ncbi:D-arabinono-1,4-lactone oxidase [Metschnikowia bicuspidata var. bicuspidata NRRL YB-4993]|uniref:D-arabinono-1,4-lactone oxidase n=1 Tax=Metschnikowia bicuspidata var. bicuspidata NRRL YB-4993 TaxID=869754 RepID=A0A1A0HGH7_9ASCO|nr:D-arabinono-1,4-lactone oxidase [Metschnikowia bicuspidata var. bicuspidata NRRL YB-4993]OBA22982.1 D-arabinono-1,4-lactone oxidase [Metschnikowia bicuspidata var. bicuspidata NRRL YB-4993]
MSVPQSLRSFLSSKAFHRTWAGTFQCKPLAVFQPSKVGEIQEMIRQARAAKKTIMTVGLGHSPLDLTMTNEWLCNLDKYNKVLKKEEFYGPATDGLGKKEVKFVDLTVEAGIRVFQLNEYLKANSLAIQNLGSISDQSIAGLISTGTHGSSQYHGLVSQQVVAITIANSKGDLVECSSVQNPELFRAALLSLGKIGIITHVTLRTVPRYTIKSKQEIIKFLTLLEKWDTLWLESEFIRIWWFPYSQNCVLWRASKSDDPLSDPRSSWYGSPLGRFFYQALLWLSVKVMPRLTPWIEKFVFGQQYGNVETLGSGDIAVQNSVEGLNMDCLFSQFVNEWSAPLQNGREVLTQLNDKIQAAAAKGDFFVHAPIEVRCLNVTNSDQPFTDEAGNPSLYPSQDWLAKRDRLSAGPVPGNNFRPLLDNSPMQTYQPDPSKISTEQLTMFVNATMYRPFGYDVETHQWYQIFENIMSEAKGKPHWAKNFIGLHGPHESDADLQTQIAFGGKPFYSMMGFDPVMKDWFGDNLIKYNNARKEMDPEGVFMSGKPWAVRNGILIE